MVETKLRKALQQDSQLKNTGIVNALPNLRN